MLRPMAGWGNLHILTKPSRALVSTCVCVSGCVVRGEIKFTFSSGFSKSQHSTHIFIRQIRVSRGDLRVTRWTEKRVASLHQP